MRVTLYYAIPIVSLLISLDAKIVHALVLKRSSEELANLNSLIQVETNLIDKIEKLANSSADQGDSTEAIDAVVHMIYCGGDYDQALKALDEKNNPLQKKDKVHTKPKPETIVWNCQSDSGICLRAPDSGLEDRHFPLTRSRRHMRPKAPRRFDALHGRPPPYPLHLVRPYSLPPH